MKIFKYLIWGMITVILSLVAIFGIEIESDPVAVDNRPDEETLLVEPAEEVPNEEGELIRVELPVLSDAERALLPKFIQVLPTEPKDGDRNGNYLRDDIEVFIAYKFPYSPQRRAVYIQMAKALDRAATDAGQTKMARQVTLWKQEQFAEKCFFDSGFTTNEYAELKAFIINNEHRREGYDTVTKRRSEIPGDLAASIILPEDACDSIILENERALQDWDPQQP